MIKEGKTIPGVLTAEEKYRSFTVRFNFSLPPTVLPVLSLVLQITYLIYTEYL